MRSGVRASKCLCCQEDHRHWITELAKQRMSSNRLEEVSSSAPWSRARLRRETPNLDASLTYMATLPRPSIAPLMRLGWPQFADHSCQSILERRSPKLLSSRDSQCLGSNHQFLFRLK